jgi:TetR/AcrR family transcriptional repressor of lmrAB and yxaGH operons
VPPHGETKRRMLDAAIEVMRERGAVGLSIDEVLARSGAPRGSVYHHFPGGRAELLRQTLDYAGQSYGAMIERAAARGAVAVLDRMIAFWTVVLTDSDFRAGCPVLAAAVNPGPDADGLAAQATRIYLDWRSRTAAVFESGGADPARAQALATTCLAALDGAVSLCRITHSLEPLRTVAESLAQLTRVR